ncbi:MAG TPA: SUMF1/EgtB/PvdO family nonheme iron enzyme, partial [Roseiflexaceae bacterium]|nr:SUMF1/EgtB/PvdO family nonheme iron enzyme [Roseiflexaceae bacterium]
AEKLQQLTLPAKYLIGHYPVTNAEYALFVANQGYDLDQPWWTEQGRFYISLMKRNQPARWDYLNFNAPNQPVVAITWHEATAYCNWLTICGHYDGWLANKAKIRLPTYAEWTRVARHTDKRRYPWASDAFDPEYANVEATKIGCPTPIGCFPKGAAVCGAQDLLGNVWEWTATLWQNPFDCQPICDARQQETIIVGKSFLDGSKRLCCGIRTKYLPFNWYSYVGFRLSLSFT